MRLSEIMSWQPIVVEGGTIIVGLPSASSPMHDFFVRCLKHPQQSIKIPISLDNYGPQGLREKAEIALKQCVGCLQTQAWFDTRFPEGAEL